MVKFSRYIIGVLLFELGFGLTFGLGTAETIQLRFRTFPVNKGNWEGIKVQTAPDEVQALTFRKNRRSAALEYHGSNRIVFFREVPHPTVEGTPAIQRVPVADIQVPSGLREALFFFVALTGESEESRKAFLIYTMDDSLAAFPVNSMVVCNLTGADLMGKIGKKTADFKTGASRAYDYSKYREKGLPVTFAVETNRGLQPVFLKRLKYSKDKRVILLFEPPGKAGSLRVVAKRIVQFVSFLE